MRKSRKRKYDLTAFLKKKGINQRILAELLDVSHPLVSEWANDGNVPLTWLARIVRLTKTEIDAKAKWKDFDVFEFRLKWDLTIAQLARELETSQPNVRNWEDAARVPRAYLEKIRKTAKRCCCRKWRKRKKKK